MHARQVSAGLKLTSGDRREIACQNFLKKFTSEKLYLPAGCWHYRQAFISISTHSLYSKKVMVF